MDLTEEQLLQTLEDEDVREVFMRMIVAHACDNVPDEFCEDDLGDSCDGCPFYYSEVDKLSEEDKAELVSKILLRVLYGKRK